MFHVFFFQKHLISCSRGGGCPGPNVSSLQTPGDTNFFSNQLAIPTVEFTYSDIPKTEVHACTYTQLLVCLAREWITVAQG